MQIQKFNVEHSNLSLLHQYFRLLPVHYGFGWDFGQTEDDDVFKERSELALEAAVGRDTPQRRLKRNASCRRIFALLVVNKF